MNGEWESATPSILTSLEMEGADVSKFVEAIDLAAGHRAERLSILEARANGKDDGIRPSSPASDPDLFEKYYRNAYNSSLRLILTDYYTKRRAALVEQARDIPQDDPQYAGLLKEISGISAALLKLPKQFRVVI